MPVSQLSYFVPGGSSDNGMEEKLTTTSEGTGHM